ncbi:MAG TPA: rRNA maturation RNase YbeY [Gammaproteobacteria bacterium]|nr:rRNA maturation RNase YbeY [Gammaproteobacteria bacterium]
MYEITVQRAVFGLTLPTTPTFKRWVKTVLKNKMPSAELTIRIVDKNEMTELNSTYRKKNKPTNVLSFPFDRPDHLDDELPILGDIVICAEVIEEEANQQQKSVESHWAHMVVHGTLHLLGYDHEKNDDAEIMEAEEIRFLSLLGYDNPYSD